MFDGTSIFRHFLNFRNFLYSPNFTSDMETPVYIIHKKLIYNDDIIIYVIAWRKIGLLYLCLNEIITFSW